jgi:glycosyltransferase involved in cell wall biosynthesis
LHGIAAVGRPIIFIGATDSEVAREVTENQLGYAAAPNDTSALADQVRRLAHDPAECARLSAAGSRYAAQNRADGAVQRWDCLLNDVGGSRVSPVSAKPSQS